MKRTNPPKCTTEQKTRLAKFLTQPDFKVPKILLSKFGPHTSVYLMVLIEKSNFDWVQFTNQEMADEMCSSPNRIKNSKKKLKDAGFIDLVYRGTPPRHWHCVNIQKLMDVIKNGGSQNV
jgi:hypothetical protein